MLKEFKKTPVVIFCLSAFSRYASEHNEIKQLRGRNSLFIRAHSSRKNIDMELA
jgi:hypothetical protein